MIHKQSITRLGSCALGLLAVLAAAVGASGGPFSIASGPMSPPGPKPVVTHYASG